MVEWRMTVPSDDRTRPVGDGERGAMTAGVHDFLAGHRDALVEELSGWIRLRSVAGVPEHVIDVRRSANWLAGTLRDTGFPSVEVWDTDGGPAVYAQWCAAPGAPTVLIYSHHDVRAAKDDNWDQTPPFQPAVRDGYLYGRGASDAKGQVMAHVWVSEPTWRPPDGRHRRSTSNSWSRVRRRPARRIWPSCWTSTATCWTRI